MQFEEFIRNSYLKRICHIWNYFFCPSTKLHWLYISSFFKISAKAIKIIENESTSDDADISGLKAQKLFEFHLMVVTNKWLSTNS